MSCPSFAGYSYAEYAFYCNALDFEMREGNSRVSLGLNMNYSIIFAIAYFSFELISLSTLYIICCIIHYAEQAAYLY